MKLIRIAQAAIIAAFIAPAAQAFDGLSFGATYGLETAHIDAPSRDYDAGTTGLHVRYLWSDGPWHFGPELNVFNISGHIAPEKGLKTEQFKHGFDVSGVIGYKIGERWLPHFFGGASMQQTTLHGSNGFHYGGGVAFKAHERALIWLRYTCRNFDGPAQGSDLDHCGASAMLSYRF